MTSYIQFDTIKKLMSLQKKELGQKQEEWEGVVKSLKNKNGHLSEQRKCLLIAYKSETKRINEEKDEQISKLREENEKLRRELQSAAGKVEIKEVQVVQNVQVSDVAKTAAVAGIAKLVFYSFVCKPIELFSA